MKTEQLLERCGLGVLALMLSACGIEASVSGLQTIDLTATQISAGGYATCVLIENGSVTCFGLNREGQLGMGDQNNLGDDSDDMGENLSTISLPSNLDVSNVQTNGSSTSGHSCALFDNGSLRCWGYGLYGQLGTEGILSLGDESGEMGDDLAAIDLGTGRTATQISLGRINTCALLDNGDVKCFGHGAFGQLGSGATSPLGDAANEMGDNLSAIALGDTATAISSGSYFNCAILSDASLKCWGDNDFGQLGQGDTDNRGDAGGEMAALTAIDLGTGRTATAVAAGDNHVCAILDNSAVKCWGSNGFGQLGLGDTSTRGDGGGEMGDTLDEVDLGTGRTATAIAVGSYHSCAILDNATAKCWGYNGWGALGKDDPNDAIGTIPGEMGDNLPAIDLGTGRTALAISAGDAHTCVLLDDYSMKCFGLNVNAQLGQGHTRDLGYSDSHMGDNLAVINLGTRLAETVE